MVLPHVSYFLVLVLALDNIFCIPGRNNFIKNYRKMACKSGTMFSLLSPFIYQIVVDEYDIMLEFFE